MNCNINIITDIIIPLISALVGGGTTLLGVIFTIKAENKKSKKEYFEKIRPFFVVETIDGLNVDKAKIKKIWITDDSEKDVAEGQVIYHWNYLLLSNMSESVCMISYIKINDEKYASFDNVPIKPGDFCEIKGAPLSMFSRKSIDNISIGFLDKNFNLYEYRIFFEIKEHTNDVEGSKKYCHKTIEFSLIDCRTNLAKIKKKLKK